MAVPGALLTTIVAAAVAAPMMPNVLELKPEEIEPIMFVFFSVPPQEKKTTAMKGRKEEEKRKKEKRKKRKGKGRNGDGGKFLAHTRVKRGKNFAKKRLSHLLFFFL